eukprot:symbB.v1.2.009823.t1/scaffold603.1/size182570/2
MEATKESSNGMSIFLVRRRAEASKEGVHLSFPMLRKEWFELSNEQREAYAKEASVEKGSAANMKQLFLEQQKQQELRKPEVKRRLSPVNLRQTRQKSRLSAATAAPLPMPCFPVARRSDPQEAMEGFRQAIQARCGGNRPVGDMDAPEDLRSVAQQLLCPRLSFDFGEEDQDLEVVPDEDQDLRRLLREELQRKISIQEVQRLIAESER